VIVTDKKHLASSRSKTELHAFAEKIGLKRLWFQDHPKHPHYDITSGRILRKALLEGAGLVTSRELIQMTQPLRYDPEMRRQRAKRCM
jgi:hypothetical protein